jgi:hypothetical protein
VQWRGLTGVPVLDSIGYATPIAGTSATDVWIGGSLHSDGVSVSKVASPITADSMSGSQHPTMDGP